MILGSTGKIFWNEIIKKIKKVAIEISKQKPGSKFTLQNILFLRKWATFKEQQFKYEKFPLIYFYTGIFQGKSNLIIEQCTNWLHEVKEEKKEY